MNQFDKQEKQFAKEFLTATLIAFVSMYITFKTICFAVGI